MQVILNPRGWHRRLQEFVFNNPPRFQSLCPYFWFTIFCIIFTFVIPIAPLVQLVKAFFRGVVWCANWLDQNVCEPAFVKLAASMDEDSILWTWSASTENEWYYPDEERNDISWWQRNMKTRDMNWKKKEKAREKFEIWKLSTPNWEQKLAEIKEKRRLHMEKVLEENRIENERLWKHQEEQAKKARERRARMQARVAKFKISKQQMFTKIAVYTKWLAWAIGAAVVALILWGLYELGIFISKVVDWPHFFHELGRFFTFAGNGLWYAKWIVLGILVAAFLIFLLVRSKWCFYCSDETARKMRRVLKAMAWPFVKFGKGVAIAVLFLIAPFVWFGRKVGSAFSFTFMFLKTNKDNICPAIIWEEGKERIVHDRD